MIQKTPDHQIAWLIGRQMGLSCAPRRSHEDHQARLSLRCDVVRRLGARRRQARPHAGRCPRCCRCARSCGRCARREGCARSCGRCARRQAGARRCGCCACRQAGLRPGGRQRTRGEGNAGSGRCACRASAPADARSGADGVRQELRGQLEVRVQVPRRRHGSGLARVVGQVDRQHQEGSERLLVQGPLRDQEVQDHARHEGPVLHGIRPGQQAGPPHRHGQHGQRLVRRRADPGRTRSPRSATCS